MRAAPALVAHADWSVDPRKRWLCIAWRTAMGWACEAPVPFGPVAARIDALQAAGPVLLGIDCPIGIPRTLADRLDIRSFRALLEQLASGRWPMFLTPAALPEDISPERPFYPARPGGTSRAHLVRGLRMASFDELRRRCDRPFAGRRAACPVLWTMGAQQCGKGAIAAWRDLLLPDLQRWSIWPFDGPLEALLAADRPVLAETYPAETCRQLDLGRFAKGRRADRANRGPALTAALDDLDAKLSSSLAAEIDDGFGERGDGEDRFDSLCGLIGLLRVLSDLSTAGPPDADAALVSVEGWMLGLSG